MGGDLHQDEVYLLFGQNEGRSEEIAVVVEAGDDGLKKVIGPE